MGGGGLWLVLVLTTSLLTCTVLATITASASPQVFEVMVVMEPARAATLPCQTSVFVHAVAASPTALPRQSISFCDMLLLLDPLVLVTVPMCLTCPGRCAPHYALLDS